MRDDSRGNIRTEAIDERAVERAGEKGVRRNPDNGINGTAAERFRLQHAHHMLLINLCNTLQHHGRISSRASSVSLCIH